MPARSALTDAALLGAAGGLRTAMPWGVLAWRGQLGGGLRRATPLASAAGELVIDKLPLTPSRTSPPGLVGRLASGALAGRRAGGGAGAGDAVVCTAVGGMAAGASAYAGERIRATVVQRSGLPDPLVAVAEDAVAIGLALAATRRRREDQHRGSRIVAP